MNPRQFLQWLLDRNGENTNSLAEKLKGATTQPQIYKYLKGVSKEPKRATLAPVAAYFKIPLDALYSESEADKAHLAIVGNAALTLPSLTASATATNHAIAPVQQAQTAINGVASLDQGIDSLLAHIGQVSPEKRAAVAGVMTALIQDPDDASMRAALAAMLTPAAFVEPQKTGTQNR